MLEMEDESVVCFDAFHINHGDDTIMIVAVALVQNLSIKPPCSGNPMTPVVIIEVNIFIISITKWHLYEFQTTHDHSVRLPSVLPVVAMKLTHLDINRINQVVLLSVRYYQ